MDSRTVAAGSAPGPAGLRGTGVRSLLEFAATPWRNGAGVSREVAASPSAERADPAELAKPTELVWRVSVAELTSDADFSTYAGYDRQFVIASDYRVGLSLDSATHTSRYELSHGQSLRFAGEAPVRVRLNGRHARALNLFVHRSRARGHVRVVRRDGTLTFAQPPRLVMLLSGSARLADGRRVPRHGIVEPGRRGMSLICDRATMAAVYVSSSSPREPVHSHLQGDPRGRLHRDAQIHLQGQETR